ncbi:MAG: ABC transporter substrate-binding protein [Deltaproteobacteria bacterium]|nr:ABC transporter substrate-binding protein [Deltaproteobacteria bacterium]MBI2538624.1 ABC transporter substrate-binding protein [Deltaproteobacteria bacterium]
MNSKRKRRGIRDLLLPRVLLGVALSLLPAAAAAAEKAALRPLEKINIAYSSISANMAPLWAAYEGRFFQKYGLDVQLIFVEGGPRAIQTLISGDVTMAQVAGSAVLQANLRGSDVVMIGGVLNTFDYQFIVDKAITRPDQLKGKIVAVSRFGSSSDFATRYALEKFNLDPTRDVTILQIGSQPARFAALEAGKIQGVMIAVPLTLKAKKMGFRVLADLQMLGLEYQHTGLAVSRALIRSRPELARTVMKAYVEGIHYYKSRRKPALAILQKYLKSDDAEGLAEAYEAIGLNLIPETPYPTLKGIGMMLQELAEKEPKARSARPEQFVDMSLVQELDSSGFISRLYKSAPPSAGGEERSIRAAAAVIKESVPVSAPAAAAQKTAKWTPVIVKAEPTPAIAEGQEYRVKAGDTLSRLAERFYGAQWKWGKIYASNTQTIKNPHYIYIGQKIVIPPDEERGT